MRLPLWFERELVQVEWAESRVSQEQFTAFMHRFSAGTATPWQGRRLEAAIRANFKIRVNVTEKPSPKGPEVTLFEIFTDEGFGRGVGSAADDGALPPVG
jgi:hypothetical protein